MSSEYRDDDETLLLENHKGLISFIRSELILDEELTIYLKCLLIQLKQIKEWCFNMWCYGLVCDCVRYHLVKVSALTHFAYSGNMSESLLYFISASHKWTTQAYCWDFCERGDGYFRHRLDRQCEAAIRHAHLHHSRCCHRSHPPTSNQPSRHPSPTCRRSSSVGRSPVPGTSRADWIGRQGSWRSRWQCPLDTMCRT